MLFVGISAGRPFRIGCFDVRDESVVAADDELPIAVEVDISSGQVIRVFSWPLSPGLRCRPVANDVLMAGDS